MFLGGLCFMWAGKVWPKHTQTGKDKVQLKRF